MLYLAAVDPELAAALEPAAEPEPVVPEVESEPALERDSRPVPALAADLQPEAAADLAAPAPGPVAEFDPVAVADPAPAPESDLDRGFGPAAPDLDRIVGSDPAVVAAALPQNSGLAFFGRAHGRCHRRAPPAYILDRIFLRPKSHCSFQLELPPGISP